MYSSHRVPFVPGLGPTAVLRGNADAVPITNPLRMHRNRARRHEAELAALKYQGYAFFCVL